MLDATKIIKALQKSEDCTVYYFMPCNEKNAEYVINLNPKCKVYFYVGSFTVDSFRINCNGELEPLDEFYSDEGGVYWVSSAFDQFSLFPIGSYKECPTLYEFFHTRDEAEGVAAYLCNKYEGGIL